MKNALSFCFASILTLLFLLAPSPGEAQLGQIGAGGMPCGPVRLGCTGCEADGGTCAMIDAGMFCFPAGPPETPYCVPSGMTCPVVDREAAESREVTWSTPDGTTFDLVVCVYPRHSDAYCLGDSISGDRLVACHTLGGEPRPYDRGDCDGDLVPNAIDLCCDPDMAIPEADARPVVDPETGCPLGTTRGLPDGGECRSLELQSCVSTAPDPCADAPFGSCECIQSGMDTCEDYACLPADAEGYYCVPGERERSQCPQRDSELIAADVYTTGEGGHFTICIYEDDLPACAVGNPAIEPGNCFHATGGGRLVSPPDGDCDGDGIPNRDDEGCLCDPSPTCGMTERDAGPRADAGQSELDAGSAPFDSGPTPPGFRYVGGGLGSCACSLSRARSEERSGRSGLLAGLLVGLLGAAWALRRRVRSAR